MKSFLQFFIFIIFLTVEIAEAQVNIPKPPLNSSGEVEYKEVISTSAPKDLLYNQARVWFTDSFHSPKDVVQLQDKEAGLLIGIGTSKTEVGLLRFKVTIEVKENRYRYSFTNISQWREKGRNLEDSEYYSIERSITQMEEKIRSGWNKKPTKEYLTLISATDRLFKSLSESLKSGMAKPKSDF